MALQHDSFFVSFKIMKQNYTEEIGKQSAALSFIEIGLGSLLHTFNIPFSGHLLSINQIAFLSRSSFKCKNKKVSLQISLVASILKSLSPAGKKLTPMLAIAAQGLLYYLGLNMAGINSIGLLLAIVLSSLWAFVQPILFIYLLFGKTSIDVTQHFLQETERFIPNADKILLWVVTGLILTKFLAAYFFSILAIKMSDTEFHNYQKKFLINVKTKKQSHHKSALTLAIRDLINPLFLISFGMTSLFFIFSNSTKSQMIWALLRPIAIGFIVFYIFRIFPMKKLSEPLRRRGFNQLANILEVAIKTIEKNND